MKSRRTPAANDQSKAQDAPQGSRTAATAAAASGEIPSSLSPKHFLIKSEPHEYSLDDLASKPGGIGQWDGIRNYRARNLLKTIKVGEQMFFYHSSCKVPAVVGIAELVKEAYPDSQSWDPSHKYYDPKSTPDNPRWFNMDIKFVRKLKREIPLSEIKAHASGALQGMVLLSVPRLSVQPVSDDHWDFILSLEDCPPAPTSTKAAGATGAAATEAAGGSATKGSRSSKKRQPAKPAAAAAAAKAETEVQQGHWRHRKRARNTSLE